MLSEVRTGEKLYACIGKVLGEDNRSRKQRP
jgi:hypothetical protein